MLDPDKNPEVRLNKEVKAFATVKLRSGIHKEMAGEPIYEHEVNDIQKITLTDEDSPNSAHVTLIRFREKWIMHFDFRYNKQKARERFDAGKEFYNVAKYCFDAKLLRPFVDALFSATELLVTATMAVIVLHLGLLYLPLQILLPQVLPLYRSRITKNRRKRIRSGICFTQI